MNVSAASSVEVESRVGPDWVAAHLADPAVRVVELDVTAAAFDTGHIPGALFWHAYGDLRQVDYRPISDEALFALLARSGIGPDTTVVFYGYAAYLGFWLLRSHGHRRVRLMDGARDRWTQAGHAWTTDRYETQRSAPAPYAVAAVSDDVITREAVRELLGDPKTVLLDVRSHEEFTGERFWPSGASQDGGRAGHLPGAVWLAADLIRSPEGKVRDVASLRRLFADAGVSPERRIVVYCTIGNRASHVWYVLRHLLEYPQVSVYYGSWAEWGTTRGQPVQTSGAVKRISRVAAGGVRRL
jgi:thiosulfate/3-mercaptopyruvate sulfurtransferase